MHQFLDDSFLLKTETAKRLYNSYAKDLPIIDYHCHINPEEILRNKAYENLTQLWLYGDHYKWRCMRAFGIDEKYITGTAPDYEKFLAFAGMMPFCIGNPVYVWSHLELKRYFGISEPLTPRTAPQIWEKTKAMLTGGNMSCRDIIRHSNVEVVCTTDDPADPLTAHQKLAEETPGFRVLPAFRPDKALEITHPGFSDYIRKLSASAGCPANTFNHLREALSRRIQYFHENGCRIADTSLSQIPFAPVSDCEVTAILQKALSGETVTPDEEEAYKTALLFAAGREYHNHGWVMQLHIGALRNNNRKMFQAAGPDTGFDSMNDLSLAGTLSKFLNAFETGGMLPKTILYNANPKDNYMLASMIGNFQSQPKGKIQFGSGWWFNDQKDGIEAQLHALANCGLLSQFVGMLTDSRSFLSYTRHEYFRRILCHMIGGWVEDGEYPADEEALKAIVEGICYKNAKEYFAF